MRILANENFPGPVVRALRERGDDVAWVREDQPGATDEVVLARAQSEHRLLVTCDKDFGELACRFRLPADCGVVLFRLSGTSPEQDNARTLAALADTSNWAGHLVVVQDDRIRMRELPSVAEGT
jgi:predicted nuclease of predicted toxin-antitoxin system